MEPINFEQLPKAVSQLHEKLNNIEKLLLSKGSPSQPEGDQLLTIDQAAELTHLAKPTLYGLVHNAQIPVCKRGKRLYFSKQELTAWIKEGRKKTKDEIALEADAYFQGKKKRG